MISLKHIIDGTYRAKDFNYPLDQLNAGKEDKLALPSRSGMVLSSDTAGNRTWIDALEIGENSSTAFRGDYGRIAYNHSQTSHDYLPQSGGILTGDLKLHSALIFGVNRIENVNSNISITSNTVTLTTNQINLSYQNFIKPHDDRLTLQSGDKIFTIRPVGSELYLDSNASKIYFSQYVVMPTLTTGQVSGSRYALNNDGLFMNGSRVIDENGSISGANIDLTADYESTWMWVNKGTTINITHGLGEHPKIVQMFFSESSFPSTIYTIPHVTYQTSTFYWWWWNNNSYLNEISSYVESMTMNTFKLKNGAQGIFRLGNKNFTSGYVKVMMWK